MKHKDLDQKLYTFMSKTDLLRSSSFPKISVIPITSIRSYVKSNFLHVHKSLEVKLRDCSTFELVFSTESARDKLLNSIITNSAYKISTLSPQMFTVENENSFTYKWLNGKLSNFAYLMAINKMAGRSIRDMSRHPIVPWCVLQMEQESVPLHDPNFFRDISKPIGYVTENERSAEFDHNFKSMERDKNPHPYYLPAFASTPQTTQLYLSHLLPSLASNREFFSLQRHTRELQSDQRSLHECVPEFFYLPEAFGEGHSTEFPAFTKPKTAAAFVYLHRMILESKVVSVMLPKWIDLFFGASSRGKDAKQNKNLYPVSVYPEKADKRIKDKTTDALQTYRETWEGGQLPAQVFWAAHEQKNASLIEQTKLRCYSNKSLKPYIVSMSLGGHKPNRTVRGSAVEISPSQEVVIVTNQSTTRVKCSVGRNPKDFKVEKLSCTVASVCDVNQLLMLPNTFFNQVRHIPVAYLDSQKLMVVGGYLDGTIKFVDTKTGELHKSMKPNNCIATTVTTAGTFILAGFSNGELFVWELLTNSHLRTVTRLRNNELDGSYVVKIQVSDSAPFAVVSFSDGTILILNYVDGAVVNTIRGSGLTDQVAICFGSPSCVVTSNPKTMSMCTYTLSGDPISKVKLEAKLVSSILTTKSVDFTDLAIAVDSKGQLHVWQLPFLKLLSTTNLNLVSPQQIGLKSSSKMGNTRSGSSILNSLRGTHEEHAVSWEDDSLQQEALDREVVCVTLDPLSQMIVVVYSNQDVYFVLPN